MQIFAIWAACLLRVGLVQGTDTRVSPDVALATVPHESINAFGMMLLAFLEPHAHLRISPEKWQQLPGPRMVGSTMESLAVDHTLMARLRENGIAKLNPLQEAALPPALLGKDVIVHAETGSGKTLCFALTILSRLQESSDGVVQAIVVVPTLELSAQIARVLNIVKPGCAASLQRNDDVLPGSQIVVGSPGLLLRSFRQKNNGMETESTVHRGTKKLVEVAPRSPKVDELAKLDNKLVQNIRIVVIDEVDSLLKTPGKYSTMSQKLNHQSHPKDAAFLLSQLCNVGGDKIQVLATSATIGRPLRREIARLTGKSFEVISAPEVVTDTRESRKIEQGARKVVLPQSLSIELETTDADNLIAAIHDVIGRAKSSSILLFIPSGLSIVATVKFLRLCDLDAVSVEEAVHNQTEIVAPLVQTPTALVSEDSPHRSKVLVASRSLARGLDLHDIQEVIIMGAPESSNEFLHLAGRTARQGKKGTVVILTTPDEVENRLPSIGQHLGVNFQSSTRHHLGQTNQKWANMWKTFLKMRGDELAPAGRKVKSRSIGRSGPSAQAAATKPAQKTRPSRIARKKYGSRTE